MNQPLGNDASGKKERAGEPRTGKMPKKKQRGAGGRGGGAPWKPGLCKGNHLVAAEAQARPGCLEKLLSSLTPFMKQEENISSV